MGYERHHAIIVSTHSEAYARKAHDFAFVTFGEQLGSVMKTPTNQWWTFLIGPDGSKEGWDESTIGDARRRDFIAWLDTQRLGDGSSPYKWVEVRYGDRKGETIVTAHSGEPSRTGPARRSHGGPPDAGEEGGVRCGPTGESWSFRWSAEVPEGVRSVVESVVREELGRETHPPKALRIDVAMDPRTSRPSLVAIDLSLNVGTGEPTESQLRQGQRNEGLTDRLKGLLSRMELEP